VGRKTANCVLVYGFGKAALPVDVHVHRIANRLGLVRTRTPEETERELWEIVPDRHRLLVNELLVKHGQTLCGPRNPRCGECPVNALCSAGSGGLKDEDGVQEARRGRNGRDSL
jgi:endonuclease-3